MMANLFKYSAVLILGFFLLSMPIGDQRLFDRLDNHLGSYTRPIYDYIFDVGQFAFQKGKKVGRQLFENTNPKLEEHIQNPTSSSILRENIDDYAAEEQELIKRAFDENR